MSNNNHIFLSHVLTSNTLGYGGKKEFELKSTLSLDNGNSCNQSEWKLNNHIGTHIDAPFHFSLKGKTLDSFEASYWIFNSVHLVNLNSVNGEIIDGANWREAIPLESELLLLKTNFESKRDTEDYWAHNPGLAPELALWLREFRPKIRVIGFDFISITSYENRALGKIAHHAFLHEDHIGNPIMAIEDMHLSELKSVPKKIIVSPLRVLQTDGSPVTVIAEL